MEAKAKFNQGRKKRIILRMLQRLGRPVSHFDRTQHRPIKKLFEMTPDGITTPFVVEAQPAKTHDGGATKNVTGLLDEPGGLFAAPVNSEWQRVLRAKLQCIQKTTKVLLESFLAWRKGTQWVCPLLPSCLRSAKTLMQ